MDDSRESDLFFFTQKGYSAEGKRFVFFVESYRKEMQQAFQEDFSDIIKDIDSKFNYRADMKDWLEYNFKGFPLVAVITKLTAMQEDIKEVKQDVLVAILSN